jgi:type IV secretory pathway TraG/TraD family ATPase VirD4
MTTGFTATGRPRQRLPLLPQLGALALATGLTLEFARYMTQDRALSRLPVLGPGAHQLAIWYEPRRAWVLEHVALVVACAVVGLVLLLALYRWWLLFWNNTVVARLSGLRANPEELSFPVRPVDVVAEIRRRPPGTYFVGLTPRPGWIGWRWKPAYLSQTQKTMHRHVLGKTGSGKTSSVLWPSVLQDVLDGKGCLVMDAKGSDENVRTMKGIAAVAGRQHQLRVLSLPAWNRAKLFTHRYNLVYVRPRTPTDPGGDPAATAERVFDCLPLGDNEYYNTQAQVMFTNLCLLMHGMVDERGFGLPFVVRDLLVCFRGIGSSAAWRRALDYCLQHSLDREAALAVEAQMRQLGGEANRCFSGIIGALERFTGEMVNAYAPDVVFEEILQQNDIVYVQLPANLFKTQAPALGRCVLADVQQEASLRQVFRTRNQTPFAVVVDEFYNFADLHIIDSLNKLRDAHLEFTLAHQSIADLELVSKEFAQAVWDNTATKDVLREDNPALCELVAKSIGTQQVAERTVRVQRGPLFTSLATGDASSKLVERYRLHPNRIKSLARCGQGYLVSDEGLWPVVYGMLPPLQADYPLPRNEQAPARGLRLYERFVQVGGAPRVAGGAPAQPGGNANVG